MTMMIVQPQARDTVAHVADDRGPSTLLIFLLVVGVLVAAYFIWKAVQNRKELPPPTPPGPGHTTTHTTNPPKH